MQISFYRLYIKRGGGGRMISRRGLRMGCHARPKSLTVWRLAARHPAFLHLNGVSESADKRHEGTLKTQPSTLNLHQSTRQTHESTRKGLLVSNRQDGKERHP